MRKRWLDNIRWAVVVLVMVYHVFYIFNGVGILGRIPGSANIPFFDKVACGIYPWFMVLLFVISGMSARFSLQKRSRKEFLKERAAKLLVPSTVGLFTLHWITGYLNIRMGGGLEEIPPALLWPIAAVSGTGPLWFIQMLFIFCAMIALFSGIDKGDRLWKLGGRVKLFGLCMLWLPLYLGAQVLNLPVLTMYRFGIYFTAFLTGYYILSHEGAQELAGRIALPSAALALILAPIYVAVYGGSDFTSDACLQGIFTNIYLWAAVLAVLGCGKRFLDFENGFTRYMKGCGFGLYILHYPALISVCCVLCEFFSLPAIWNYILALAGEMVLTVGAYEIIKRLPVVRWAVLGKQPKN